MSARNTHLTFAEQVEFAEQNLAVDSASEVRAHIDDCPVCAREQGKLTETFLAMRGDRSEDVPSHVHNRALRLFNEAGRAAPASALRRLLAQMVFDSGLQPALAAVRGQSATGRQRLYATADHEIEITVAPEGDGWRIAGQLLGPVAPAEFDLRMGDQTRSLILDDSMEFSFDSCRPGRYTCSVRLRGEVIDVPEFEVGL